MHVATPNAQIQPTGLKSSAPQQRDGPFFGAAPLKEPFFPPLIQRQPEQGEEDSLQREATGAGVPEVTPAIAQQLSQSKGGGTPLPARSNKEMSHAFGRDLSAVRIHQDTGAAQLSRQLQAKAFTHGNDIYFGENEHTGDKAGKHLLAHELTHVVQQRSTQVIARLPKVAPSKVDRKKQVAILGDGTAANPGMSLEEFNGYIRRQADWFVDPSLKKEADRNALWAMIAKLKEGPHILAGAGDLKLNDLMALAPADWDALAAFGHGCHQDETVIILNTTPALPRRIVLGNAMKQMNALIGGGVLRATVSEQQLIDLEAAWAVRWPRISDYWKDFKPHLQQIYEPAVGARGIEFQKILDMFAAVVPASFKLLQGKIRNLHRFKLPVLFKLMANYSNKLRLLPVHLILHTGNDASAFQNAAANFEDLIINSPRLVLMLEGRDSFKDIMTEVTNIANTYGQDDGTGTFRIEQIMVAGHGSPYSMQLAGTSAPIVKGKHVDYTTESLDISTPKSKANTQALLDLLIKLLPNDPAKARLIFAGCLVGANEVPAGTAAPNVLPYITANPNLSEFARQRALAAKKGVTVEGARASVALAKTSLRDPVTNDMKIIYPFDPQALGTAAAYVAEGHEPEGVMRAAVEVAATNPLTAANQLRLRQAFKVVSDKWWDECVMAMVNVALDGVAPGGPVSLARLLELSEVGSYPFLSGFGVDYGVVPWHYVNKINPLAIAPVIYQKMLNETSLKAPVGTKQQLGRFIIEQGWLNLDPARAAAFVTYLDGVPSPFVREMETHLDITAVGKSDAVLFAPAAPHTAGRIRLGLAWLQKDPANPLVKAFFQTEITDTAAGPVLSAALTAQLAGRGPEEILEPLGRLARRSTKPGDNRPLANAQIRGVGGRKSNTLLIDLNAYTATVTSLKKTPVFRGPGPKHTGIGWLAPGKVIQVAGFTDGWAAFDFSGTLGYVNQADISPP